MGLLGRLQAGLAAPPQMDADKEGKWSARSQRDSLELVRCRAHIERIDIWIKILRKNVDDLESRKAQYVSQVAAGNGSSDLMLAGLIDDLRSKRERLQAYEDSKAELQARIRVLQEPSEDRKRERRERQLRIARLAEQRAKVDGEVAAALEGAVKLLNERAELTRSMRQECEAIGFAFVEDHLDEARFEELGKHLPADLAQHSREWLDWFFGKQSNDMVCKVTSESVSIAETLASPNVYLKGETVRMKHEDYKRLRSAVAPAM